LVYGVVLARNFRDVLLGMKSRPDYMLPAAATANQQIVDYWRSRWLSGRIRNEEVLQAVGAHDLVAPIRHGARVVLPQMTEVGGTACVDEPVGEVTGGDENWSSVPSADDPEAEADRIVTASVV
jgi:hypothetical protein